MESDPNRKITHDFPPFLRVYSSGQIERYIQHDFTPPSPHPQDGVVSKDVAISSENNVSARIYLPSESATSAAKLPLIIYFHGGAFCLESAFSSRYHRHINSLASKSQCVVVSVEYRLAPEHPIPACYEDCLEAIKWVGSESAKPDPWIADHADLQRVYFMGDSAGANIAHDVVFRLAEDNHRVGFRLAGLILVHPFFGTTKPDKLWDFICHDNNALNLFRFNPAGDLDRLSKLVCDRVLICAAEEDFLRKRAEYYYKALEGSDWKGVVEYFETPNEGHVFHLLDSGSDKTVELLTRVVGFVRSEAPALSHI